MTKTSNEVRALRLGYREQAKGALNAMLYTYFVENDDGDEWEAISNLCTDFIAELDRETDK